MDLVARSFLLFPFFPLSFFEAYILNELTLVSIFFTFTREKCRILPPSIVAAEPPTSLPSLPVELLDAIFELLDWDDQLTLCRVSYRILEVASKLIYGDHILLDADDAYLLVEARVSSRISHSLVLYPFVPLTRPSTLTRFFIQVFNPSLKSPRITSLLLPYKLRFVDSPTNNAFKALVDLASSLDSPPPTIRIEVLTVEIEECDELELWKDLLRFVDPTAFQLWTGEEETQTILPTPRFVPSNYVASFASRWNHLEELSSTGPGSVLLLEGTESTSAFEACLRRCSPDLPFVQTDIWTQTLDNVETVYSVVGGGIPEALKEVKVPASGLRTVSLDLSPRKRRR